MNREELGKMISLIDDDKLAEAETGTLDKSCIATRPFWQKSALIAAAVVLVITASFIWTKLGPGFNPTEITTTAPQETTTAATIISPKWEEREVYEKYTGGAMINEIEYQSSVRELDADLIDVELGSLRLSGYDIYEDKTYEIDATFYQIQDIDPDCVVAVRYEGHEGYYGFFNTTYAFKTLADLITRLNLPEHLQLNNTFIHSVWQGEKQKDLLRWDYYSLPDPGIVWDQLLAQTAIVNEGEAIRDKPGWE
ncbi:MAG: hypothetical protein SCM11_16640, partial [Bacillota bacterium]|nr:hypothetical protein [Bacillota bacterium]